MSCLGGLVLTSDVVPGAWLWSCFDGASLATRIVHPSWLVPRRSSPFSFKSTLLSLLQVISKEAFEKEKKIPKENKEDAGWSVPKKRQGRAREKAPIVSKNS